ncbi:hypothetical protein O1R50_16450 [Glycomyces luteolus]|uniref:Uncharacterized protein n=1 Tax=Glycomyces luteolus TaxID=2670330 RepID=A0A9X3PCX8_9ACTN|nr:hypothetical protein [Glycomyces luteolus]MDA1361223.1 hypothetical protein [Glycomyces luteolus]
MILIVGSIFGAIPAVSVIRLGEGSLVNFWMLGLTAVTFGVGAAIGAFGVAHSVTRIDSRGLARRQSNGRFHELKRLRQGQRFVIAKNCLCIQLPDGTIEKTEIARWRLRRKDWDLVEQQYPDADPADARLSDRRG